MADEIRTEAQQGKDAEEAAAYRASRAAQLDHLFRQAGDSPEIRLIYQAVLAFHLTRGPA